jgi:hypothetical protein
MPSSMSAHKSPLVWVTLLLVACGESTPPARTVDVPPPSESAKPAASTSSTSEPPKAWQPPERATKEAVRRECGPLLDALQGTAKGEASEIEKAVREKLESLTQNPPLPAAPFEWCKTQFLIELDRLKETQAKHETSYDRAKANLGQIGKDMASAYERENGSGKHQLCPSAKPVPAKLDTSGAAYKSRDSDWKDPGWRCLKFELTEPQDFQYEVKVEGNTFSAIARRAGADPVELVLTGKLDPETKLLSVAPTIEEKRKPQRPK